MAAADVDVVGQVAAGKVRFLSYVFVVPMATASVMEQASLRPLLMFITCASNGGCSAGKNTETLKITGVSDSEVVFLSKVRQG